MTNSNNEDYLSKVGDYKKTDGIKDSNFEDDERGEIRAFLRRQAN